jgi:glycosyltransferase involved in cell wall biosynthesis
LRVYGTGEPDYVERVMQHARNLELGDESVEFCGHVDGAEKARAFEQADLCVVPSFTENFCMVVAESLAYAVPVIASTGTPWQAVENHACGVWIDAQAPALVAAFRELAKADLSAMGSRGRDWMIREFSWGSVASRMLDVYRSLTDHAGTKS